MPTLSLPQDPSVVQLRKMARELQRGLRSGDPDALALVVDHYPGADITDAPLHLAQLVLARSYGFSSWPRLVNQLEVIRKLSRSPVAEAHDDLPVDVFLRQAVLLYSADDGPARWAIARELIEADPTIGRANIYAATAAADHGAVRSFLALDPSLADRPGGPMAWDPLLYLTYARYDQDVPLRDVLATAELLLRSGADPNAGFLWNGLPTPFTALTGVFGAGEQGIGKQPPHPHALALGRVLLEAGADPNDGQALYNRMFEPDNSHLELLFEYGLGAGDGGPWRSALPELTMSPQQLVRNQLNWAIGHGMADRVRLLAAHGVDLVAPFEGGHLGSESLTPVGLARISGRPQIARLLADLGAPADAADAESELVGALLAGDAECAGRLTAADPDLLEHARQRHRSLILRAAVAGSRGGIQLLIDNGFDIDAKGRRDLPVEQEWETALHFAAGEGDLELVDLLLAAGADPTVRDRRFDSTPLGWAEHLDHPEVVARLRRLTDEAAPTA